MQMLKAFWIGPMTKTELSLYLVPVTMMWENFGDAILEEAINPLASVNKNILHFFHAPRLPKRKNKKTVQSISFEVLKT